MMHIRKTIVNLTAQNFDYLCNRMQGRTLGGGGGGSVTPPQSIENCKKSVQDSFKIVKKVGLVSRSRDVFYTLFLKTKIYSMKINSSLPNGCLYTFMIDKPRMLTR